MITRVLLEGAARCNEPATTENLRDAHATFPHPLPQDYSELMACSNGLVSNSYPEITLYPLSDVVERNDTFNVGQYAPRLLLIGDDSGGRGVFLNLAARANGPYPVVLLPFSSLGVDEPTVLAASLEQWAGSGFYVPDEDGV